MSPELRQCRAGFARLRMPAATWILMATVLAGALNYLYALCMTALLAPSQYSVFAGGLATTLVTGTVANTAVPWLLAREISNAARGRRVRGVVWFAAVLNLIVGLLAAGLAMAVSSGFSGIGVVAWLGAATLGFFMASTGMGWAQGHERFGLLAALIVAEVAIKVLAGLVLVATGAGVAGAFAAALIGALAVTVVMVRPMWHELRPSLAALRSRRLWRAAAGMGGVQSLVTLLSVIDVLFVTLRFGPARLTADYQVAATLTRAPLFIALALATAAFPQLARRAGDRAVLSAHARHVLVVLAPLLVVLATLPGPLLAGLLPAGYDRAVRFVPLTAAISTAYGLVVVQSTIFRAAGCTRDCIAILGCACAVSLGAMTLGSLLGVYGLAAGALAGGLFAVCALTAQIERRWPGAQRPELRALLAWPALALALVFAREVPVLWVCLAGAVALYAVYAALNSPGPSLQAPPARLPASPPDVPEDAAARWVMPANSTQAHPSSPPILGTVKR